VRFSAGGGHNERLGFIEGLRGLAVGMVLILHACIWSAVGASAFHVLQLGAAGVDLFFVISGFCMLWPQLEEKEVLPLEPVRFYARRAIRIWPPYAVAVATALMFSLLTWKEGGPSWWGQPMQSILPASPGHLIGNVVSHLTFTHGFIPGYDHAIDGAFWSLATEWQFYALLPLLILVSRRWGVPSVIALTVLISATYTLLADKVDSGWLLSQIGRDLIFYRLVEFGAGMLVAWLIKGHRRLPFLPLITAAAICYAIYVDYYGSPGLLSFGWAAGFGMAVWCAASHRTVRSWMEWNPLRQLGKISYSVYLIHGTVLQIIAIPLTRAHAGLPTRTAIMYVIGLPAAVLAGRGLNQLIETRAVRWSRSIRSVRQPLPMSVSPA
jgi:peptidoglycan/LPS O-acetylase OafA/YrhL